MLKTQNKLSFGINPGIHLIQASKGSSNPVAAIKPHVLQIEQEVRNKGSEITSYKVIPRGVILIEKKAEAFMQRIRQELSAKGINDEQLDTKVKEELIKEAGTIIYAEA